MASDGGTVTGRTTSKVPSISEVSFGPGSLSEKDFAVNMAEFIGLKVVHGIHESNRIMRQRIAVRAIAKATTVGDLKRVMLWERGVK